MTWKTQKKKGGGKIEVINLTNQHQFNACLVTSAFWQQNYATQINFNNILNEPLLLNSVNCIISVWCHKHLPKWLICSILIVTRERKRNIKSEIWWFCLFWNTLKLEDHQNKQIFQAWEKVVIIVLIIIVRFTNPMAYKACSLYATYKQKDHLNRYETSSFQQNQTSVCTFHTTTKPKDIF